MSELLIKTRDALLKAGTTPRKSLSQNFLVNQNLLNKQIEYAEINRDDTVLEIGGGTGLLTEQLAKIAHEVFCIEYDEKLAQFLTAKFASNKQTTILHADALKIKWPKANKVVANLPYHISSPLTFKLLEYDFDLAVLMYQYEFAKRMIAEPNTDDYSRLSVNLQYQANVEILQRVPRNYFYPMPKVDSAIVKITPKKIDLPVEPIYYRNTSRILFNTKNKIVASVLYDYFKRKIRKENRKKVRKLLDEQVSHSNLRVREITVDILVQITQDLRSIIKSEKLVNILE